MIWRDLLCPLGLVFDQATTWRRRFYQGGFFKSFVVDVPVVSIGNITVGGTGKTPLLLHLARGLAEKNIAVGIVSRGYGGSVRGVEPVDLSIGLKNAADKFGDEPTMLREKLQVPVFVGADRVLTCQELLKNHQVNLILADDAFQHMRLRRQIDLVVLDALAPRWQYRALPWGLARENLQALKQAQWVVVTKGNLLTPDELQDWYRDLGISAQNLVRADYAISQVCYVNNKLNKPLRKVLLASGIGRPESFERLVREHSYEIAYHKIYSDHYLYQAPDVLELVSLCQKHQVDGLIVTEKDAVKLKGFKELEPWLCVAELKINLSGAVERLNAELVGLVR